VDTALTMCKEVQTMLRPELRLLVMSATLGPTLIDRLSTLLRPGEGEGELHAQETPLIRSKGRSYPLTTHYVGAPAVGRGEMERCGFAAIPRVACES
jgi:ATP-dependent helicase HrpB